YLRLESVAKLLSHLQKKGVMHKSTRNGLRIADKALTEHALYGILKHPVYIGKTYHRGEVYDGQHDAIIETEVWEQARSLIKEQARSKEGRFNPTGMLLQGKLYDLKGRKYRCHYSEKPNQKRHHYYVSKDKSRIPAALIENAILVALRHPDVPKALNLNEEQKIRWLRTLFSQPAQLIQPLVQKVTIGKEATWIRLATDYPESQIPQLNDQDADSLPEADILPEITINQKPEHLEIKLPQSFAEKNAVYANRASQHNEALRTALGQGFKWQQMLHDDPKLEQRVLAKQEGIDYRYLTRVLHMMILAPDIMESILDGTQPHHLSMATFRKTNLPICWQEQRVMLGFALQ
ncbi:MAG: recombinase family protein, partial [Rickettsiales bacterium]